MATFTFESIAPIIPPGKTGVEYKGTVTYTVTEGVTSVTVKVTNIKLASKEAYGSVKYAIKIGSTGVASGTLNVPNGGVAAESMDVSKTVNKGTAEKDVAISVTSSTNNFDGATAYVIVPALESYTISYYANGGSGAPAAEVKYYGRTYNISSVVPTRAGYTFKEWCTNMQDTGTGKYEPGASYTANSGLTLYAIWNPTITYKPNGASGSDQTQGKTFNQSVTIKPSNTFTKTNYVFRSWNTNPAGTGTPYTAGMTYTGNTSLVLYAIWYPPHTVTYNANGGTNAPSAGTKVHGQTYVISSSSPTRLGYRFMGWNTNSAGTGTAHTAGESYSAEANLTLYAVWSRETVSPTISTMKVLRCDSSGNADDFGTYCKVTATWYVDTSSSFNPSNVGTVTGRYHASNSSSETPFSWQSGDSGTSSGTALAIIPNISNDSAYVITVTVTDKADDKNIRRSSSRSDVCTTSHFILDFRAGGGAVGIGRPAPQSGLGIGWPTLVSGGSVKVMDDAIDRDSTPSSNNIFTDGHALDLLDKDGEIMGRVRTTKATNGTAGIQLVTWNEADGGSSSAYYNVFQVGVSKSGVRQYSMSDPAAFRSAIAAIAKAGDTMTGALNLKTDTIDRDGANPVSAEYDDAHALIYKDADGETYGKVRMQRGTDGSVAITMQVRGEKTDGTEVVNEITVTSKRDGTRAYSVTDPAAFRSAIGLSDTSTTSGWVDYEVDDGTISQTNFVKSSFTAYKVCGRICQFYLSGRLNVAVAASGNVVLGTLPSGYRPVLSIGVDAHSVYRRAVVSPNGNVTLTTSTALTANTSITVSGVFISS